MPQNDPYYRTEFPDLKYMRESSFIAGKEGYLKKESNPYPKYNQQDRADWFTGYLFQQRISLREERIKSAVPSLVSQGTK